MAKEIINYIEKINSVSNFIYIIHLYKYYL